MYLKRIYDENVGPIEKLDIGLSFTEKGNPKPTIFVGENGSGKSILLSNVVDAFYEISSVAYTDSKVKAESGDKIHFKGLFSNEIKIGESHLLSYLKFFDPDDKVSGAESIFKMGKLDRPDIESRIQQNLPGNFELRGTDHYKKHSASKEFGDKMFGKEIICYFPPSRYAIPSWQSPAYSLEYNMSDITLTNKENGLIHNNITVTDDSEENIAWLLDVLIDSRTEFFPFLHKISGFVSEDILIQDIFKFREVLEKVDPDIRSKMGLEIATYLCENFNQNAILHLARQNTEKILSEILGEEVYFDLQARNHFGRRFGIKKMSDDSIYTTNINTLSTGQLALLNMFISIIRYSDRNNIGTSIQLDQISGIVVIDEIELHLHSKLQRDVLPKLIKLMSKVQFIITSHSPLFLLGMQKEFGEEGFDIYEMPIGMKKNAEDFSEFQVAYDYMTQTAFHRNQISVEISKYQEKTLVVTEGASDWIHMKAALNHFKDKGEFLDLNFHFFEFLSGDNTKEGVTTLEMGWSNVVAMCEQYAKMKQPRKIIFIVDNDVTTALTKLKCKDISYHSWGNCVFSMSLRVPHFREKTPDISIEHYYRDEEIKTNTFTNDVGIQRRLFMSNEFNLRGFTSDNVYQFKKIQKYDLDSIKIIDDEIWKRDEESEIITNFALPKMKFAQNILHKTPPFDNFDFSSFRKLFEIIEEICNLP